MPRIKIQPGEHSEPEAKPYRLVSVTDPETGAERAVKRPAENVRQATSWRARCQFRALDGKRVDLQRWGKTKREALAALEGALADRRHASSDGTLKPSTPFVVAGDVWFTQIKRPEARKSARTIEAYLGAWSRYVDVEGCALRGLTITQANDVQRVLALLQRVADNHGSGAAKMTRTVLSGIFDMGVKRGVLPANAARSVGPVKALNPKPSKRDKRRSLTLPERAKVIEVADGMAASFAEADPRTARKWQMTADLIAFLAGTGVRISEAAMLQWRHLNLSTGVAEVHGTKTAGSLRAVNLPEWLLVRLQRRHEASDGTGLVFASPALVGSSDTPVDLSNLQGWVRVVLDKAELGWATSHSFRRTVATLLHEGGAPLVRIADQLGHANPAMTASVYLGRDLRGDKADLAALL